ncbi:MAG: hypothetical protein Q8Q09_01735 [Deltaproteobacteria bacterium]|nr:hypothetical protein [Deltaproteobacteria bacterium]
MTTPSFRALGLSLALALAACAPAPTTSPDVTSTDASPAQDAANSSALCAEYCTIAAAHCDGPNTLYANTGACMTACAAFPLTGARNDTTGNSLFCRLYHVDQPASMTPATHCPHAGPSGGGVCQ